MGYNTVVRTLINVSRVGPGSFSALGSYVGLGNVREVCIHFEGSYAASAGTNARLDLFSAFAESPGSIGSKIGSIPIAVASNSVKRALGTLPLALPMPFIVAKAFYNGGSAGLVNVKAQAILRIDR